MTANPLLSNAWFTCGTLMHSTKTGRRRPYQRSAAAYLKKVVPIGTVELAAQHAAALEICAENRTGTGRSGRAFRLALSARPRRDRPV